MTTHDNAAPMPDWRPEPHCGCPFDDHCVVCRPEPRLHDGIELGEN